LKYSKQRIGSIWIFKVSEVIVINNKVIKKRMLRVELFF
jgi:hypothetical protein